MCLWDCAVVTYLLANIDFSWSALPLLSQDSADDGLHPEGPGRGPGAAAPWRRPRTEKQGRLELLPHRLQGGRAAGRPAPASRCAGRLEGGEQDAQDSATHCR